MDTQNWCTIESDPGVFTELIETMGAKDATVEELFTLSDESFDAIAPAFGLLFLFKWTKETSGTGELKPLAHEETDPELFFAKQTITNACATQAILSVLLNSSNRVDVGEELKSFRDFTKEFNPEMKGDTLGSNPMIRGAHNMFARPEPFIMEDSSASSSGRRKQNRDDDDDDSASYHFIAYIPHKGGLYELDGLQRGPILLSQGEFKEDDIESSAWLRAVRPHIEARIRRYEQTEIRFNLMAVIRDRRKVLQERIEKAEQENKPDEVQTLRDELVQVEEKRKQWTEENIRRKHNYVPFIVAALRLLARRKKLKGLVRAAQEKEAERKRTRG
jgi:ubiquitin carboxyl-terminal hydrolase L5